MRAFYVKSTLTRNYVVKYSRECARSLIARFISVLGCKKKISLCNRDALTST